MYYVYVCISEDPDDLPESNDSTRSFQSIKDCEDEPTYKNSPDQMAGGFIIPDEVSMLSPIEHCGTSQLHSSTIKGNTYSDAFLISKFSGFLLYRGKHG